MLRKPEAPADIAHAFRSQLRDYLWAQPDALLQGYVGAQPEIPTLESLGPTEGAALIHDAQPVFALTLKAAAGNAGARAFTPAGWRLFAGDKQGGILLGKVSRRNPHEGWKMTASYYGERVWNAYMATLALEQLPQIQSGEYQLRLLTVPGLNLEAFWLAAPPGRGTDLVVPFPAPPNQNIEPLNREPVLTLANFLAAIRPAARLRLTVDSSYGG